MNNSYEYVHRAYPNGAWDSICMHCFRTAAISGTEISLVAGETLHRCNSNDLARLWDASAKGHEGWRVSGALLNAGIAARS